MFENYILLRKIERSLSLITNVPIITSHYTLVKIFTLMRDETSSKYLENSLLSECECGRKVAFCFIALDYYTRVISRSRINRVNNWFF